MAGQGKWGRAALPASQVVQCRRLLAQGLSQRQIVQQLGISKGTVWSIANGKYRMPLQKRRRFRPLPEPVRCGGCGGLITFVPCLVCQLNHRRARSPAGPAASPHYRRPSLS